MWKLLRVAILVAVLSSYHTDASRKIDKNAIKNKKRQTQFLEPPFFESLKLKRDDKNSIVIDPPKGYYYTTPKQDGYVYTKGGYVYVTPTSTPGTSYIPPKRTSTTTTTTTSTTPSTTTTTTTTTPSTTTTTTTPSTTTTTTTPSTTTTTTTTTPPTTTSTFKPTYLPPHKYTYLPPPEPSTTTIRVTAKSYPPPTPKYTPFPIKSTSYVINIPTGKPHSPPTLRTTTPRPHIGYEYLPPKIVYDYLPPKNIYLPSKTANDESY